VLKEEVPAYPVGHVAKSFGPCIAGGLTIGIVRDTVQEQHHNNTTTTTTTTTLEYHFEEQNSICWPGEFSSF